MQNEMTMDRLTSDLRGADVYDSAGDKIGAVEEIYYDNETNEPEWIGIGTGFFGSKHVLVPVQGASTSGDGVTVPYTKAQVKDAPDVDADEISQETERELSAYYGVGYSERRSDTGLPEVDRDWTVDVDRERSDEVGEGTLTRSEEELKVGKRQVETGKARLRKWVETEPVEADVTLQRERVQVRRETIDQPVSGADIGEQEIEVSVHREEPVVSKETVAKERIGLEKDVETETETVRDDVRKERVELEDADERLR